MNSFILASNIPEDYKHIADLKMPFSSLTYPIVSALLVLALAVILIILIKRQHKLSGLCIFAGVSIFMLFNFFLVMLLTMFLPNANEVVFIIVVSLISALVPFMGRLIVIKAFSRQHNVMGSHISYGIGIMGMKGFVSALTYIIPISNYYQLTKYGVEYFFPEGEDLALAEARAKNFENILTYEYSEYILLAIMAIGVMMYSISVTVPIYAAFKGGKSKLWYGFAFGMGFLVTISECVYNRTRFVIPAVVVMIVAAAVTTVVSYKLYKTMDYSDEQTDNTEKEPGIAQNAKVKIPKFKDLDKL